MPRNGEEVTEVIEFANRMWVLHQRYLSVGETWTGPRAIHFFVTRPQKFETIQMIGFRRFSDNGRPMNPSEYWDAGHVNDATKDCWMTWLEPFNDLPEFGEYSL